MQLKSTFPLYKQAPFVRLLAALILGILLQWYCKIPLTILIVIAIIAVLVIITAALFFAERHILKLYLQSLGLQIILVIVGCGLVLIKDVRQHKNYLAKVVTNNAHQTVLTLTEPLVVKAKSYKAMAKVLQIIHGDTIATANANVILYIKKDSSQPLLQYGSVILTNKPLQLIKNSGNPGAFNYEQQSLFNGVTHQLFINTNDYVVLNYTISNWFKKYLYSLRNYVLQSIATNIPSAKEKGIAEALLIGYRDDLDKDLVQAYSNTGTIHVIAISGLHLGFIYLIIVSLFKPFAKQKWIQLVVKPIVTISILWIFSLLAGGAPSILRSAIMFTCIALGESFSKKTSIHNTLAISAFIILCINPFSLWDVGFQLSYAAVLSIVFFMQPIYKLLYVKHKVLDWLWKLNAVTLSAQILTIPITIYHFHQFPNLFLLTNLVAVPLSSIILAVELLLIALSWQPLLAGLLGKVVYALTWVMNSFTEWCNSFTFAITDYLQLSLLQCILMYIIIIAFTYWLLQKYKPSLYIALLVLVISLSINIKQVVQTNTQHQLIVYNVANQQAIDIVSGTQYSFIGDTAMYTNVLLKNFHLKPSRVLYGTKTNSATYPYQHHPMYLLGGNNVLLIDASYNYTTPTGKAIVAVAVLSKNPKVYMDSLAQHFSLQQVVADASNPLWKIKLWQNDCARLNIPFYNTNENGAFVKSF